MRRTMGVGPGAGEPSAPAAGSPAGGRIDAARAADLGEGGSVRRLVVDAQHLVDVLVRQLVLEHLAHDAPRLLVDERARQRRSCASRAPTRPGAVARVGERERGRPKRAAEVVVRELGPGGGELAKKRGVERGSGSEGGGGRRATRGHGEPTGA